MENWDFMRYSKKEIDKAIEDGTWPPSKMMCGKCKDVLQSKYPGQFVECKCGESFVDQTPHYSRDGGFVQEYGISNSKKDTNNSDETTKIRS